MLHCARRAEQRVPACCWQYLERLEFFFGHLDEVDDNLRALLAGLEVAQQGVAGRPLGRDALLDVESLFALVADARVQRQRAAGRTHVHVELLALLVFVRVAVVVVAAVRRRVVRALVVVVLVRLALRVVRLYITTCVRWTRATRCRPPPRPLRFVIIVVVLYRLAFRLFADSSSTNKQLFQMDPSS